MNNKTQFPCMTTTTDSDAPGVWRKWIKAKQITCTNTDTENVSKLLILEIREIETIRYVCFMHRTISTRFPQNRKEIIDFIVRKLPESKENIVELTIFLDSREANELFGIPFGFDEEEIARKQKVRQIQEDILRALAKELGEIQMLALNAKAPGWRAARIAFDLNDHQRRLRDYARTAGLTLGPVSQVKDRVIIDWTQVVWAENDCP